LGAEDNVMDTDSDAGASLPDPKTDGVKFEGKEAEDNDSAIYRICTEENTLVRLMSRLKLPEELKSKYHQVHSVMDFYLRSLTKYEKLKTVFDSSLEGADLILAVERFRELFRSYKDCVTDELLDALTVIAISLQSDQLADKVNDAISVACGVSSIERKALHIEMISSGVLPQASGPSDILRSAGAREFFSPDGSKALKSIRQFVVSYCGYFDDVLQKALSAENAHATMCFDESMDLQARFSAEKRAFNMATL
jgi:hypothetical protein